MTKVLFVLILICISRSQQLDDWTNIKPIRANVPPQSHIIGGEEVEPHSAPYQVGLRINGNQYFCGGALISANYVITAAHCGIVIRTVDVVLGAHNITNSAEPSQRFISGQTLIQHPGYNDTSYVNDIALIQLSETVTFSDDIQPINLPAQPDQLYDYAIARATGWGLVTDVPFPSISYMSSVLMGVDVAVTNTSDCTQYYNDDEFTWVTDGNICTTGYRNKGTCQGDSGGPLTLNGVLIGLTSFGTDLCELCTPSVYTKVDRYLDFIVENSDVVI